MIDSQVCRAAVARYLALPNVCNRPFDTIQADISPDAEQFIDSADHVVVVGRFRGRAKNGTVLDAPFVHVWKMRNGKATNFYHHVETSALDEGVGWIARRWRWQRFGLSSWDLMGR